jgi:hypothetical protein
MKEPRDSRIGRRAWITGQFGNANSEITIE